MNNATRDQTCTRRELYRTLLRGAALGGVTLMTGMLAWRGRGATITENPCINRGFCRECGVVRGCGLPAALSYRQAAGEQRDG